MAYPKSIRGRGPAKIQRCRSRPNPGGSLDRLLTQRAHQRQEAAELALWRFAAVPGAKTHGHQLRLGVHDQELAQPTGVRARLYDRRLRLTGDTRNLAPSGAPIEVLPLAPPGEETASGLLSRIELAYEDFIALFRE